MFVQGETLDEEEKKRARPDIKDDEAEPKEDDPAVDTQYPSEFDGAGEEATETETSSDEEAKMTAADPDSDMHVLKMLYKGNLEEANRREEQTRRSHYVSHKHNVYRNTRCTSMWQEEQSALAGGVINTYLDSDDEDGTDWQKIYASFPTTAIFAQRSSSSSIPATVFKQLIRVLAGKEDFARVNAHFQRRGQFPYLADEDKKHCCLYCYGVA